MNIQTESADMAKRNMIKNMYERKLAEAKRSLEQRTIFQYYESSFLDIENKA